MSDELPDGWACADFFDFCVLQRGYDLPLALVKSGPYPVMSSAGVVAHHAEFKARSPGVVTGRSGSIGRVFFVESDYWPHNTALFVKDFKGNDPKYVYFFLRGFDITKYSASTAVPTLNRNNLRDVTVNVPPLGEQRRIVAKLETVLGKVDASQQRLAKIPVVLKRFRQSVLAAACSGCLTADWREANPGVETLNQTGHGQTPDNFELPNSWGWLLSAHAFDFVTSGSRGWARYYADDGPRFLRVGNLDHDSIQLDLRSIQHVRPPDNAEGKRTRVQLGDLLVSVTADVGMVALVETDIGEAYINQHVALGRPNGNMDRRYLAYFLSAKNGGQHQFRNLQRGATKVGLGLEDIKNVWIARPPLPEQQEIVRRVEGLFALADQLEMRLAPQQA